MSDGINIKVSTGKLVEVSGSVTEQISRTRKAFSEIEKTIDKSSGYWEGSGHNAFLSVYQNKLQKINESLARFTENVEDLQQMAGLYDTGEHEATEMSAALPNDFIV